jgi:hypothetical protein
VTEFLAKDHEDDGQQGQRLNQDAASCKHS